MKSTALDRRLFSAAELVRQGAHFADVGTDHAYLPLFLLRTGRIADAVCTDVNRGPLETAKRNARDVGQNDKISFVLTDGAKELSEYGITDMAICGMGGELIAEIIDKAPYLKDGSVRLILQPMSRQGHLRRYLASAGFSIVEERYSYDAGKYYLCLAAEYTARITQLSDFESEFGEIPSRAEISPEHMGYLVGKARALEAKIKAMEQGGHNTQKEREIYDKLCAAIAEEEK